MSLNTTFTLNIAGRSSNEFYSVAVPSNLLGFCRYDFSRFMEECSRLCRECMKSGEYPLDRVIALRNSVSGCHRYVENNIRTVFDKIVTDCWIEYICRQGEISSANLWNSLIGSRDPFQNAIFQRLTEYRTHKAINQWINLLKIQEYAKKKLDFVFGCKLASSDEAAVRLNFFDLMFSVAANEQGYSLDSIGSVRFSKPGRASGAPFVYGGVSKEIVKNLFKDVRFADSQPYVSREEGAMSDWEAMDAFAAIKNYLPEYNDSVAKIILKSLNKTPDNIYTPSSFKAMIDLEIDTVINMGGYLQRCAKCGEYFFKNRHSTSEYCDTVHRDGTTCRELMEGEAIEPLSDEELLVFNEKAERLYHKMAEKVNFEISQRDFTEWSGNFDVMRKNVICGRATDSDFDDFVEYSEQLANQKMSRAKQSVLAAVQEEMIRPDGTRAQVKPYQFTRIDRKELEKQGMLKPQDSEEKLPPISEEKKAAEKPTTPVAHIIRGASPTSYHEIPVESRPGVRETAVPVKPDVFVGEDFSQTAQPAAANTIGTNAAASAKDAQAEILRMAEQERARRSRENLEAAERAGITQNIRGSQNVQSYQKPEQGQNAQPYQKPEQGQSGQPQTVDLNQEKKKQPHFPDLEDFPDNDETETAAVTHTVRGGSGQGTAEHGSQNQSGSLGTERESQYPSRVKEQWEQRADVELHAEEPAKNKPPQIKLFEFDDEEKNKEHFVTLVGGRERSEHKETQAYEPEEASDAEPIPVIDLEEREEAIRAELSELSKLTRAPQEPQPEEQPRSETPKPETPVKKPPKNRAAKVAGAYRSVAQMPESSRQENEAGESSTADDFAKILSNIERNDGFDDESIPLDPDGVPLSHKTKHVMDALMRNSGVSPSLTYGRRQAAEKNVIIDEEYLEKKKKK